MFSFLIEEFNNSLGVSRAPAQTINLFAKISKVPPASLPQTSFLTLKECFELASKHKHCNKCAALLSFLVLRTITL